MRHSILALTLIGCAAADATMHPNATHDLDAAAPLSNTGGTGCDYAAVDVDADFLDADLNAGASLAILAQPWDDVLHWDARGEQTDLYLDVAATGAVRHVTSANPDCPDFLLLEAVVTMVTDDGRLDEVFDANVRNDGAGALRLERWVALDQLVGDWNPAKFDPVEHAAADVEVVANLSLGSSAGELALYATRKDGETEAWDVARWPAP